MERKVGCFGYAYVQIQNESKWGGDGKVDTVTDCDLRGQVFKFISKCLGFFQGDLVILAVLPATWLHRHVKNISPNVVNNSQHWWWQTIFLDAVDVGIAAPSTLWHVGLYAKSEAPNTSLLLTIILGLRKTHMLLTAYSPEAEEKRQNNFISYQF